jgi:succinoglycan biosynthesis transport protein ExoP
MAKESAPNPLISGELSPLSIFRMLWKQKIRIVCAWIPLLVVTAVVVYKLPAVYKAEAVVLVDSQKIPEKYVTSTVNADVGDRLATIGQQIMTTTRLLKIINTYNLYPNERKTKPEEEVIEMMRKDISLQVEKGWSGGRPGAFRLGCEGNDPRLVAEIANQLANLYVEENLKTREVQAEGTSDFIESKLSEAKKTLDDLEARVSKFKSQYNGALPEQETSLLGTISNLQMQLQGTQDAMNRYQQNKVSLEAAQSSARATERLLSAQVDRVMSTPASTLAAAERSISSGDPAVPRTRLEVLEDQLGKMRVRYGPNYPDLKSLQEEVDRTRQEQASQVATAKNLAQEQRTAPKAPAAQASQDPKLTPKELVEARERIMNLEAQIFLADRDIAYQSKEHERILKEISSYQARVDRLPVVEQGMAGLTRDYEISKANYKSLLDKKMAAGMATDMERRQKSERFEIIDPARVPEVPVKPNRPLMATIGSVLSIAIGLLLGFGIEIRKSAVLGEWELPADVLVLGRVPLMVTKAASERWSHGRMAVIASSALVCLIAIGVGAYLFWGRGV